MRNPKLRGHDLTKESPGRKGSLRLAWPPGQTVAQTPLPTLDICDGRIDSRGITFLLIRSEESRR
jgi:hypothetical protein